MSGSGNILRSVSCIANEDCRSTMPLMHGSRPRAGRATSHESPWCRRSRLLDSVFFFPLCSVWWHLTQPCMICCVCWRQGPPVQAQEGTSLVTCTLMHTHKPPAQPQPQPHARETCPDPIPTSRYHILGSRVSSPDRMMINAIIVLEAARLPTFQAT